jgi:hypothetical protein
MLLSSQIRVYQCFSRSAVAFPNPTFKKCAGFGSTTLQNILYYNDLFTKNIISYRNLSFLDFLHKTAEIRRKTSSDTIIRTFSNDEQGIFKSDKSTQTRQAYTASTLR